MRPPITRAVLALLALAACDSVPEPLAVGGTGRIAGVAFLDRNGSGALDTGDRPYRSLSISLTDWGSGRVEATTSTDSTGAYSFRDVPVGRYRVHVDAAQLGDSVAVTIGLDSVVTVAVSDSLAPQVRLALAYPTRSIAAIRALPAGKPVLFIARVAGVVGDTAFLWDGNRAIRAPGSILSAPVAPGTLDGDSVRVVGRTGRASGQPTVDSATIIPLSALAAATPAGESSHDAAGAAAGAYDAAAVRVDSATVLDTVSVGGVSFLRVDDGSGPLDVRLGVGVRFGFTSFLPGIVLHAAGVLLPSGDAGRWVLVPRALADLEVTTIVSPFAPSAPSALAGTAVDSLVTLTWTDNSGAETGFQVERRGGGTSVFSRRAAPGPNTQTLADSAGANGAYGYRVRACNGLVCSAWSNEDTVATVPSPPVNLTAQPRTLAIQLAWVDPSRVEKRFEIQRKPLGGEFAPAGEVAADIQSKRDEPLPAGVEQTYRVRACNDAGCSRWSNEDSAIPVAAPP